MVGVLDAIQGVVQGVVAPVAGVFTKKEERKQAHNSAMAALAQAKETDATQVTLANTDVEKILAGNLATSWKDEYVTVSVVGIINAVVVGGILQGFGHPEFLQGVLLGVTTLKTLFDLNFVMTAVVTSAVGLSVWKKL